MGSKGRATETNIQRDVRAKKLLKSFEEATDGMKWKKGNGRKEMKEVKKVGLHLGW